MYRYIVRLLLLTALAWPAVAGVVMLEPAAGRHNPVNLSGHLSVLCVADSQETIEEIAAPARAGEFVALPALLLQGYTKNTCWLRFQLQRAPDAPEEWLLEVGMPYLDDVTLFVPARMRERDATPRFQSLQLGDRFPYAERPIPHRLFVFPLHLPGAEPLTAYLRIQTTSTMLLETLNVWQTSGLFASTQQETAWYWLVFGIIALGALSNLVFSVWLRESIYRSYTFYLVALLVLNLSNSGFATQWLWPQQPLVADRAIGVLTALIFLIALTFFNEVLGLRQSFPRLGRAIPVVVVFYVACAFLAVIGYYSAVAALLQLVALAVTVCVALAGPWLLWQGKKNLRLFVLAFSTQIVIGIAVLVRNLGLWPLNIAIDHFILSATAIHVVLLNFALAERMRFAQREKLALEKKAARLQAEQEALDVQHEFMSMVAHEFRTPLAIIDTSAQRIASSQQRSADKLRERCGNIRAATQRMTLLMDGFLTLDRIDGDRQTFAPTACNPAEIVQRVVAEFDQGRIKVRQTHLPEQIYCDAMQLRIALGNLLANALRYSPPDKLVRFSMCGHPGGGIEFAVEDDGPGIPADEIPKLFQKYFRGRTAQTQPGAGLGLYLVERIAELHGGSIAVDSSPGMGSRFVLLLPGNVA